jgi:dynein heavy chain, axonemal
VLAVRAAPAPYNLGKPAVHCLARRTAGSDLALPCPRRPEQVEKVEAEQALSEAIPALEEAAAALNELKRDDITEIRSFAKPHILVQKVRPLGPDPPGTE